MHILSSTGGELELDSLAGKIYAFGYHI